MNAPVILYHRIDGEGEPLLLLNGVAMSVSSWDLISRPFSESFRVVRCDFRGQLMMPVTPPDDVADHAGDVIAQCVVRIDASEVESHVINQSGFRHDSCGFCSLFNGYAAICVFIHALANSNDEIGADGLAHGIENFQCEAYPVIQ